MTGQPYNNSTEQDWLELVQAAVWSGDFASAEKISKAGLIQYPKSVDLRRSLAGIYFQTYRLSHSELLLRELLVEHANDISSAFLLARLLIKQCRNLAASDVIVNAFKFNTFDAELAIQAIELLSDCDHTYHAAVVAENAIRFSPADARLHAYAGMLHLRLGEFDRARERYLFAMQHAPDACEWGVPYGLASAQHYEQKTHPDFDLFRRCAEYKNLSLKGLTSLRFAQGKASDDVGDYPVAAQHFRQANASAHKIINWSAKHWRRGVQAQLSLPELPRLAAMATDFIPIFIVGMPRSGTTLVAELLSKFPGVCNRGELRWMADLAQNARLTGRPDHNELRSAATLYMSRVRQDDSEEARWYIDKQPMNFRYVNLILMLFPSAKIIHCQRNGRDVALSLWMQPFVDHLQGYAYHFDDIFTVLRDSWRLMDHWKRRFGSSIRTLYYEDLVQNPEQAISALAGWLGLSRRPVERDKPLPGSITTSSLWQARQPIYTRSINRWKSYSSLIPELMKFPEYL